MNNMRHPIARPIVGADPAFVASPPSQQAVSAKGFNPGEVEKLREALWTYIRKGNRCDDAVCADLNGDNCTCGQEFRAALGSTGQSDGDEA